jgi:hypothetical protein
MKIATFLESKLDEVLGIYINGTSAAVSSQSTKSLAARTTR